jgi:hypothetical protein
MLVIPDVCETFWTPSDPEGVYKRKETNITTPKYAKNILKNA